MYIEQVLNEVLELIRQQNALLSAMAERLDRLEGEGYYTHAELCEKLRVSEKTLHTMRGRGEVVGIRKGKRAWAYAKSQFRNGGGSAVETAPYGNMQTITNHG